MWIMKFWFQNSIFFHNSLEELHEHVSPDILPDEYGGKGGSFSNHEIHSVIMKHEKHFREVRDMADSYNKHHSQKWNEI